MLELKKLQQSLPLQLHSSKIKIFNKDKKGRYENVSVSTVENVEYEFEFY